MGRSWACVLLLGLCAVPAMASGYSDYMHGVNAEFVGAFDVAVTAFTAALKDGDLAPAYVPNAYFRRATADMALNKCDAAAADASAAIKLKADYLDAYTLRADANTCLRNYDAALADDTAAIALSPTDKLYRRRAWLEWRMGHFADAAKDYAGALKLYDQQPYNVIWYGLSAARAGDFDAGDFADRVSRLRSDDWPVPVAEFLRGRDSADEVYGAAGDSDKDLAAAKTCEADFYIADWQLIHGKVDAAKPLLQKAVDECPHDFIEYISAQIELQRLN